MKYYKVQKLKSLKPRVAYGKYMVNKQYLSSYIVSWLQHNKAAVDANGWLPTGDIATIDQEGYFHITGRIKDVIKSGGEWISPAAIENTVLLHNKVGTLAALLELVGCAHGLPVCLSRHL